MSEQQTATPVYFQEEKPASVRLWHWVSLIVLVCSLATVILGSTLFRTKDNITMVQEQVAMKGGTVTPDQARKVAHEYSDKLWMLHKYLGYGLAFLLFTRIVTEVRLSKDKTIGAGIRKALGYPASFDRKHYLTVQFGYVAFYILFILMATTGLILAFEDQQWLDPLHDPAKAMHKAVQWALYAYMVLHIGGTVAAELTKYPGVVSRMIGGKR
jgi:Ni/Fe-hydrogenase 1 B-type cytochrome subunit